FEHLGVRQPIKSTTASCPITGNMPALSRIPYIKAILNPIKDYRIKLPLSHISRSYFGSTCGVGAFLCLDIVYGVTGANDMLRLWLASSLPMSFQMDFALLPSFPRLLGFPTDHDDHFFIASYRF